MRTVRKQRGHVHGRHNAGPGTPAAALRPREWPRPKGHGSVLPHLPPGGPSPAGLGAPCEPTNSIRCHGPGHTTGTHGLLPFRILSHQGPRRPLSRSPRHGQQVGSCSPRDVLPLTCSPELPVPVTLTSVGDGALTNH